MLDTVVLARLRAGDRRALAEVFDEHGGMVFRLCRVMTRDTALSEALSAEVFLDLWRHPERVRGPLRDHLAAAALDGLPAHQRDALLLATLDGHTYAEVAQLLGVPADDVKSYLTDALVALRP